MPILYEEKLGSISIYSGYKQKSKGAAGICRICGMKMLVGDPVVVIHKIGEIPTKLHAKCSEAFSLAIMKASYFTEEE